MGITLNGEKYVWTNRHRFSAQYPFENVGDLNAENVESNDDTHDGIKIFCKNQWMVDKK